MRKFYFVAASSIFLFMTASCGNSVQDMVDQYNEGFTTAYTTVSKEETEEILEPGDEGFSQRTLLFDSYTVYDVGTLNLFAPKSCRSFSWILTDPSIKNGDNVVKVKFFDGAIQSERKTSEYVVYIPESGLEIGHTYFLTLTVIGKDGRTYSDVAQIFTVEFHIEVD